MDIRALGRFDGPMRTTVLAGAVVGLLLGAAAPAIGASADPSVFVSGQRTPVGFASTIAGRGLRRHAKVPHHATVKLKRTTAGVVAGLEAEITITAPPRQSIVAATAQLVTKAGRVLHTWPGSFGQGPVLIDGQFRRAAGVLVSIPEATEVPRGCVIITYALFRVGGKSLVTG